MAEINRINIDHIKLDKKILKTKTKAFYFRHQYKLLFYRLRDLGDCETRNIENIQKKKKKKTESRRNTNPGFFVPNNLFFIISEADRALATISEK